MPEQLAQFSTQWSDAAPVDHLIRLAEIIKVLKLPARTVAQLRASPVTDGLILANLAFRVGQRLLRGKAVAARAAGNFRPRIADDVAQLPRAFHEEVAREYVAVVFHHRIAVTGLMHGASAGPLSSQRLGDAIEKADTHPAALRPP